MLLTPKTLMVRISYLVLNSVHVDRIITAYMALKNTRSVGVINSSEEMVT